MAIPHSELVTLAESKRTLVYDDPKRLCSPPVSATRLTYSQVDAAEHARMEQITVRVPEDEKESLQAAADEAGESLSEHLRRRIRTHDEDTIDDDRVAEYRERIQTLRDRIDALRDDREDKIRLEARVDQLQTDLERVRDERDAAQARLNETRAKLKVHNSESESDSESAFSRLRSWLSPGE